MEISVQNGLGFLDGWFGGLSHGLTLLPIPPMSSAPELAYRLQHARAGALIVDEKAIVQIGLRSPSAVFFSAPSFSSIVMAVQSGWIRANPPLVPSSKQIVSFRKGTTRRTMGPRR